MPLNVLLAPPEVETRIAASSPVTIVDSPLPVEGEYLAHPTERTIATAARSIDLTLLATPAPTIRPASSDAS